MKKGVTDQAKRSAKPMGKKGGTAAADHVSKEFKTSKRGSGADRPPDDSGISKKFLVMSFVYAGWIAFLLYVAWVNVSAGNQ